MIASRGPIPSSSRPQSFASSPNSLRIVTQVQLLRFSEIGALEAEIRRINGEAEANSRSVVEMEGTLAKERTIRGNVKTYIQHLVPSPTHQTFSVGRDRKQPLSVLTSQVIENLAIHTESVASPCARTVLITTATHALCGSDPQIVGRLTGVLNHSRGIHPRRYRLGATSSPIIGRQTRASDGGDGVSDGGAGFPAARPLLRLFGCRRPRRSGMGGRRPQKNGGPPPLLWLAIPPHCAWPPCSVTRCLCTSGWRHLPQTRSIPASAHAGANELNVAPTPSSSVTVFQRLPSSSPFPLREPVVVAGHDFGRIWRTAGVAPGILLFLGCLRFPYAYTSLLSWSSCGHACHDVFAAIFVNTQAVFGMLL